ncbi:MAG: M28 family peptidase [Bacteroidota bacterium]|nr:M28 family peptidase [Bacteroidota bacterium]MDP4215058.1 M28 family peptidase [Bacteroidota bacterium]MDP4244289.1 M28 family peptidase [Bacteroidota bacterium]MDP4252781.1 M28 family peptidase [Bacteroidota bacterium]MDP4257534.1 M28 family peptidase [Bacteroidota bacterium]
MKNRMGLICLALIGFGNAHAQTGMVVTSTEVSNILKGSYTASTYQASTVITNPDIISAGLLGAISPDSLKADLFAMRRFQNRNTFSDTVSNTRGIGAARRWVYNKFLQYSSANENRLRVAYLQFTYAPASAGCSGTSSINRHYNVLGVLPGSQTADKSLIIVEGHLDSRNSNNCDVTGDAFGIGDNATGSALVMELARVMSKYTFKNTIVFMVNTGEEQGTVGGQAFADYLSNLNIPVKAVNNNDVSGGIFCGHTSSAPSCPFYGAIDSTDLRIFSLGSFNSPHKQWARYVKLEYKEQLSGISTVQTNIQIMTNEDRTGRGGDHQPFRADGYTAVRFTQANEDGNASNGPGYTDRQHNIRDSLGLDKNGDGVEDSLYVDLDYLARNAVINGNSMAMVALGPDTTTLTAAVISANRISVKFSPAGQPAYRVAIRSTTNDWDSVYTITGRSADTVIIPYGLNTTFYISAAAVDNSNTESQFSTEYALTTQMTVLALTDTTTSLPPTAAAGYGIELLQNKPNPFDEATTITVLSGTDYFQDRAMITICSLDGRVVERIKLPLKKGINEVVYDHGYGVTGTYICSLLIDGLPVQSRKMIFTRK